MTLILSSMYDIIFVSSSPLILGIFQSVITRLTSELCLLIYSIAALGSSKATVLYLADFKPSQNKLAKSGSSSITMICLLGLCAKISKDFLIFQDLNFTYINIKKFILIIICLCLLALSC